MKKLITLLWCMFMLVAAFGQEFEGTIHYANTYKSNDPQVTDQQLGELLGTVQVYYYKSGKYKSESNGSFVQWQLYIPSENRLYSKLSNSETAFWTMGSDPGDEVLAVEINKDVEEVLGYRCDEVILTCKEGVQKYLFNATLGVDASLFANHTFGNWYDFLSVSKALPLKSITVSDEFTWESVATAVTPLQLDESQFDLPAGMETQKSPF
jgi:hypothetical protein